MVGQEDLKQFREDLKEFHRVTGQFYRGEITVPQYKSFSGGFGSYAQRGGKRSMLRLRLPAGEIGKEKLLFIKESIEKYSINMVHLTTCQTVQLHNLTEQQVCSLVEEAFDHGIITRGGGGDFPRNVMCSPLSGVQNGEAFDVQPFAKAAGDYLLSLINRVKLPRKLKVCFSNGVDNEVHATFRDMGFVAKENQTFDVYIAGGLGVRPKFGVLVAEDVKPEEVLYHIRSMVDVFTKYGNYEKRSESRSRFLQDKLTPEGLREAY
ncbi:MAG: nitrite/sulfite reductase, partial [Lachnospiraceae bacterium]|nr:nitrite/sulfite reductase [Lachnospiraceae bacterium]